MRSTKQYEDGSHEEPQEGNYDHGHIDENEMIDTRHYRHDRQGYRHDRQGQDNDREDTNSEQRDESDEGDDPYLHQDDRESDRET